MQALRIGVLGVRYSGGSRGRVVALAPEPANAETLERCISDVIDTVSLRCGAPSVVAPTRGQRPWYHGLRGLFGKVDADAIVNPRRFTPREALLSGALTDELEFAAVHFRDERGRVRALAWSGRSFIGIWIADDSGSTWTDIEPGVAVGTPRRDLSTSWDTILAQGPKLSERLPRATLHGDEASWTDGHRALGFDAELSYETPAVYLPPEQDWAMAAPAWAKDLRADVVADFVALGARVVEWPGATVRDVPPAVR